MYYGPNGTTDYALVQCLNHEEDKNVLQYSAPIDKIRLVLREKERLIKLKNADSGDSVETTIWIDVKGHLLAVLGSTRGKTLENWIILARDLPPEIHEMLRTHRNISQAHLLTKYLTGKDGHTGAPKFKIGMPFCVQSLEILIKCKERNKRFSGLEFANQVCLPLKSVRFAKNR